MQMMSAAAAARTHWIPRFAGGDVPLEALTLHGAAPGVILRVAAGVMLYAWAAAHQHRCHVILANLRPKEGGSRYSIPRGDWFDRVSGPHFAAEIIIYAAIGLVRHAAGAVEGRAADAGARR